MREFFLFLSAVVQQWVAIVTGGVVSAVALTLGTFADFQPTPYVVLGVFVLGLFVAFFLAWRDEHRRAAHSVVLAVAVPHGRISALRDGMLQQMCKDIPMGG